MVVVVDGAEDMVFSERLKGGVAWLRGLCKRGSRRKGSVYLSSFVVWG
jgi:hypothetical protein